MNSTAVNGWTEAKLEHITFSHELPLDYVCVAMAAKVDVAS